MALQTLTVREARNQLYALVDQAQNEQPVVLTNDQTAEPVAMLIEPALYSQLTRNDTARLVSRISKINELVELLAQQWHVEPIRQAFPSTWRWYLEGIWEASSHREEPFRQLVVLLQIALDDFAMSDFTKNHLSVLQKCIYTLQNVYMNANDLIACDDALTQVGFPVYMSFVADMMELYVNEL